MTPAEHIGLAVLQRSGRSGRMFGNFLAMRDVMAETEDLLGTLGLGDLMHRKVGEIAYGQQRLLRDRRRHGVEAEGAAARRARRRCAAE